MGSTRYWTRPRELDAVRFNEFAQACAANCAGFEERLAEAVFSEEEVRFSGRPECEPFIVERVSTGRERDGVVFEFCKTQHLPYDEAVDKCLQLLKEHFPEVTLPEPS